MIPHFSTLWNTFPSMVMYSARLGEFFKTDIRDGLPSPALSRGGMYPYSVPLVFKIQTKTTRVIKWLNTHA